MSLPVPVAKKGFVLQELIDEFVKSEVMEKDDAWYLSWSYVPISLKLILFIGIVHDAKYHVVRVKPFQ